MWVQLIWERALCKTLEKILRKWKTAQYLQIIVLQEHIHFPLLSFVLEKFVLNYVNFELYEIFRNAPLSQNATTCFGSLLHWSPHSFQHCPCCRGLITLGKRGPRLNPAPAINLPSPTQVLISEATGRLLNQSHTTKWKEQSPLPTFKIMNAF